MFANHCLGGLKYEATTAAIVMAGIVISFVPEYVGARIFLWRLSKHSFPASPTPEQDQDSKRAATNEAPIGHHLIHSGDAQEQAPALQKLKVNIMEAGIIFHSLCKSPLVNVQDALLTRDSDWSHFSRGWRLRVHHSLCCDRVPSDVRRSRSRVAH